MLRQVLHIHSRPHIRSYHIKKSSFQLARTNIFNFDRPSEYPHLLKDLCTRNDKTIAELRECIRMLHQQNRLANAHLQNEKPLNMEKLRVLEEKLQETLNDQPDQTIILVKK